MVGHVVAGCSAIASGKLRCMAAAVVACNDTHTATGDSQTGEEQFFGRRDIDLAGRAGDSVLRSPGRVGDVNPGTDCAAGVESDIGSAREVQHGIAGRYGNIASGQYFKCGSGNKCGCGRSGIGHDGSGDAHTAIHCDFQ